jgi:hypothetical protein
LDSFEHSLSPDEGIDKVGPIYQFVRRLGFIAIVEERINQQFADVTNENENDDGDLDIRKPFVSRKNGQRRRRKNPRDQRRYHDANDHAA